MLDVEGKLADIAMGPAGELPVDEVWFVALAMNQTVAPEIFGARLNQPMAVLAGKQLECIWQY